MPSRRLSAAVSAGVSAALLVGHLVVPAFADTNVKLPLNVNFQVESTVTPAGFTADYGQAYDANRGFGWTDAAGVPASLVGNGRERGVAGDKRLDTFMQMQLRSFAPGVHVDGHWKAAVPNGTYQVTVAAGDPSYTDSHNVVRVEGQTALDFVPAGTATSESNTVTVTVTDQFLNIDAEGGDNTKINYIQVVSTDATAPHVTAVDPATGATGVSISAAVTVQLSDGVLASSANATSLRVLDPNNNQVAGYYNVDGAYSNATFVPSSPLATNTKYTIETTTELKNQKGEPYVPFTSSFTTGTSGVAQAPVSFTKTVLDAQDGPTAMTMGPDGALYVATLQGDILKYTLDAQGKKVGEPAHISPFLFTRIITSLKFDPSSTATNPKLWVSHGFLCDGDCANFTGTISVLTGANLQTRRDVITGLPRSIGNHMNNGLEFGADGRLYWAQGANNGFGAPDAIWGNRGEDPLTAAILVADVNRDPRFANPVNVNTSTGYNPNAADAAVKIYASGTRNPYTVISHSNGKLYAPVNESANGNTPAGPNNVPPALTNLPAGPDYFTEVVAGKYYGHPNPSRGQYVLNGGNPTAGVDPFEVPQYPVGTATDPNYRAPDLNLGQHRSANGTVEFKSDVFGGNLKGQILVTEYAHGKDIIAVSLDANGKPLPSPKQVASGFYNPLGITVDQASGRIYVGEFGADPTGVGGQITLLTPNVTTQPPVTGASVKVDFTTEGAVAPAGYTKDYGQAFDANRKYGWEDLAGSPVDLIGNGRKRNAVTDERLDSFIHMQLPSNGPAGVPVEGRWQLGIPNGTYTVTVGVGDPSYLDSRHVIRAEENVIVDFTPVQGTNTKVVTAQVAVTDGRLTIDAVGGTNTKLAYIDVAGETAPPVTSAVAKVNFSLEGTAASDDFSLDFGQAFDAARGFGWQDFAGTPLNITGNARDRGISLADRRLASFIHMQLPDNGAPGVITPGRWELIVPNGKYKVTIGVGDPSYADSYHVIRAEGVTVVDFQPTAGELSKVVTVDVTVTDGRLTLDPIGGNNTKLAYVDVVTVDGSNVPADTAAPAVTVTPSGTTNSAGAYVDGATIAIQATDSNSGVRNITYTLNSGASQAYNAPFSVTTPGTHTIVATAVDNAGNTGRVTRTFTVVSSPAGNGAIKVTGTEDYLGIGNRVVFSTVGYEVRAPKSVVISNSGSGALNITNLTVSGPQASAFGFDPTQARSFSIPAGGAVSVPLTFRPAVTYVNKATLTITSNDAARPSMTVSIGGLNPPAYEDVHEPSLQEIIDGLGYTTKAGVTDETTNFISKASTAVGDERLSAYWSRVDASKPVQLHPLAHFSGRSTGGKGPFGFNAQNSTSVKASLLGFPGGADESGGENQRILPKIAAGGTTDFNPSATYSPFGVFGPENAYSEDALTGGDRLHAIRFYPAKDAAGVQVPNTWIVGIDIGTVDCCFKNFDYQDYVFLMTNAQPFTAPVTPAAPQPGDPSLNLNFSAAVNGTIADSTGQGTGFRSVQANAAGNHYAAGRLVLDAAAGRLRVTSTAGTNGGSANSQQNALQTAFNATGANWRAQTRLIGPFTGLRDGSDQQAMYFGPDQDNHIKLEIEYAAGAGVVLTIWLEQNGAGRIVQRIPVPSGTISSLDLFLDGNPTAGTVRASYRVNSSATNAVTALGTATAVPAAWFATTAQAGVLVSHTGSTTSHVATYDSFSITRS